MRSTTGTFLLFAMAAVALAVVMVFAFFKTVELQRTQSVSAVFPMMAQEAALYGVRHIQEEMVKDYRRETVATLDAPGRASLRAVNLPMSNDAEGADSSSERLLDQVDAAMEGRISRPLWEERLFINRDTTTLIHDGNSDWFYGGGRGRWFEVEFRNRTDPSATTLPATVGFPWDDGNDLDGAAQQGDREAGTTSADIQQPVAFTGAWNRYSVPTSAAEARDVRRYARYRLRYAATVRDLDAALLINPDPGIDWPTFRWNDPRRAEYDATQAAVMRHAHVVPAVVTALIGFGRVNDPNEFGSVPEAMQHVFLGRGHRANVARGSPGGTNPLVGNLPLDGSTTDVTPRTYPLMYRSRDRIAAMGTALYSYASPTLETGGSPLPLTANQNYEGLSVGLNLTGPQVSFYNAERATFYSEEGGGKAATPLLVGITPFGRGLSGSSLTFSRTISGPYDGWTSTPWKVNVLTAPPAVLRALLYAYMPPGVVKALPAVTAEPKLRSVDLFNETHSPAFTYEAPRRASPAIYPDYYTADSRSAAQRYPGALMTNQGWQAGDPHDNLGAGIALSAQRLSTPSLAVVDPYLNTTVFDAARMPHADSYWSDIMVGFSNAVAVAKRGHMRNPYTKFRSDLNAATPPFQSTVTPSTDEADALGDPMARPMTTAEFDRLFLACMGVDMTRQGPGMNDDIGYLWSLQPVGNPPWADWYDGTRAHIRTVKNTALARATIRSLRTAATVTLDQSAVMELVLNDFRVSFFASDPAYTPTFAPLDFNGDGYATCSAYHKDRAVNPSVTSGIGLDQDCRADAAGRGDWTVADIIKSDADPSRIRPFCITGCVFVGRSRFWEVQVRGEVYDNRIKRPIAKATLQTVFVLDPEGVIDPGDPTVHDQANSHVLFQRWYYDRYSALMARE